MPATKADFERRINELRAALVEQGRSVQKAIERSVDAAFERDAGKAKLVIEGDRAIDHADVQLERQAVALLTEASGSGASLDAVGVRSLLTIVKVNNELERIADCAVNIAERSPAFDGLAIPAKFRVMANSVIGIMHTTNAALAQLDRVAAELVLASDDTTDAFARAVVEDTLEDLIAGRFTIAHAQALQAVAANLGQMADHCTNVAEQVIYLVTGKVVRHEGDRWSKPEDVA